jgi:hypothetical protein
MRIDFVGGGTAEQVKVVVDEQIAGYPDAGKFAPLPAYGFYARHVSDLRLSRSRFSCRANDLRPAVVCDDVANVAIESVSAASPPGETPLVRFRQARDSMIRGCQPARGTTLFLRVEGAASGAIRLLSNDFSGVNTPFTFSDGADISCLREAGNLK